MDKIYISDKLTLMNNYWVTATEMSAQQRSALLAAHVASVTYGSKTTIIRCTALIQ